jgi:uncharacterized protein (TIRG00374 family)
VSGARSDGHPEPLRERGAAKGLAAFIVLTVAGLLVLFTATTRDAGGWMVPTLHGGFLLLAVASAALDILIGALRYHLFIRRIRPGTRLWLPIRADLANRFVGAVTPSQTGGGPAQVFILHRGGIPVPEALSFLALNFLCTLVVFLATGGAAAWALGDRVPAGVATHLVRYGGAVLVAGLGLIVFALGRPDSCARILGRGAARLERVPASWASAFARVARYLAGGADRYRSTCARFVREDPFLPLAALLLTLLLYLNKFTLAWLVMRGLGADGDYGTTLAVQALLHLVLYVAPTPGGSGIAELATGTLMAVVLPGALLGPFTLAYRVLLLYAPATVGACVLAGELKPKREGPPARSRGEEVRKASGATVRRLGSSFGV